MKFKYNETLPKQSVSQVRCLSVPYCKIQENLKVGLSLTESNREVKVTLSSPAVFNGGRQNSTVLARFIGNADGIITLYPLCCATNTYS